MKNNIIIGKVCLLFFAILFPLTVLAQVQIKGTIVDKETKIGVPFTHIRLSSTPSIGAISDQLGRFEITLEDKNVDLLISAVGYETLEVSASSLSNNATIYLNTSELELDQVIISADNEEVTRHQIAKVDLAARPIKNSQEILRYVPGLFIGQHAGGGKAEQIFLRGFDIDHGTDINISVDGMPVNMVSHAHGQGYADMHFIIPETIDYVDFGKGAYYSEYGNFTTAGYVNIQTKRRLDKSSIKAEMGQFNTKRIVGMFNLYNSSTQNTWIASEYLKTDGPVKSPQNFNRFNLLAKHNWFLADGGTVSLQGSIFASDWNASGQIPMRAVNSGLIDWFGAIDDTEGGQTARQNLQLEVIKPLGANTFIKHQSYLSRYLFELYSNFTFFLDDPVNGDQIKQKEERVLYGSKTSIETDYNLDDWKAKSTLGFGFRNDVVDGNELSHTKNRDEVLEYLALGKVNESNYFAWLNQSFTKDRFNAEIGLRIDQFSFNYTDDLTEAYDYKTEDQTFVSPNLKLNYLLSDQWKVYVKAGRSFHSNDSRVVVSEPNKRTLPAAYGVDLGFDYKPFAHTWLNLAFWRLDLEQEFVYVGDAAVVEESGKTRRYGIEFSVRSQLNKYFYLMGDANYTIARSTEEADGEDYIPLAPKFTSLAGLHYSNNGWNFALNYRMMGDRPANEDDSITAEGYGIFDLNAAYKYNSWEVFTTIENLFDRKWKETQFDTESRLYDEAEPVSEIHFTPGTPFFFKAGFKIIF